MEMTYSEPQTPLFPPYVNLVNAKDHWKIGESEHNTDRDVTVRITNSYAPNICIYPPTGAPLRILGPLDSIFTRGGGGGGWGGDIV